TFFYVTENDAKRGNKLFRHVLGTDPAKDPLIYEEKDERFNLYVRRSRSRAFVMLGIYSHTTTEERFLDAKRPAGAFATILPRVPEVEYDAEHRGGSFFVVTNDKGRTKRLIEIPVANPAKGKQVELIPVRPDVMLERIDLFQDFYVVVERTEGLRRLRAIDFRSHKETTFAMPEEDYFVGGSENAGMATRQYRHSYTPMGTPFPTTARDMATGATRVIKVTPVPGYDASRYETRRLFATARDGTKVPVSVAAKKGTPLDGSSPMLLRAYGSYGFPQDAFFL